MGAGDWIKVSNSVRNNPRLGMLAGRIDPAKVDRRVIALGIITSLWMLADECAEIVGDDGFLDFTLEELDGHLGPGVSALIPDAWLKSDGKRLRLPGYVRHNGSTTKNRILSARRSRESRERTTDSSSERSIVRNERSTGTASNQEPEPEPEDSLHSSDPSDAKAGLVVGGSKGGDPPAPPRSKANSKTLERKPRRRKWRVIHNADGKPDIDGVDAADLALDLERGPDVDAAALRRERFAPWVIDREVEGNPLKDLRRAFYRLANPERREQGGFLVREQASAAEGRSPFAKGNLEAGVTAGPEAFRVTMPTHGSWPINQRGWIEAQDGEWFDVRRVEAQGGERFFLSVSGWIAAEGAGATGEGLRRATLDEVFGIFAEPGRDPEVSQKWRVELGFAGERGAKLARGYARNGRAKLARSLNGSASSEPSSAAEVFAPNRNGGDS